MLKFLKKPYPFNNDFKHNIKIIFFISIGVFLFLFLFQPFEISTLDLRKKIYIIWGIVLVIFLSFSVNLLFLPAIHPKMFLYGKWNIKKEILWNTWILFTIVAGYVIFYNLMNLNIFKISSYAIVQGLLIAILPISVLITINQNRLLRSYLMSAIEMNKKLEEKKNVKETEVTFVSEYLKDNLKIKLISLIYIHSASNYIEIFWEKDKQIKMQMVRTSLIKAEELLKKYKFIFKCHRSYIININRIDKIEGGSQGYKVFFKNIETPVNVSRNYTNELEELV